MNLTGHIILKDIHRLKWLLLVWALLGSYCLLFVGGARLGPGLSGMSPLAAFVAFIGLSLSLIAWIIQEDEVTQSTMFWRTRPISPSRMLSAKLALLGTFFVILPSISIAAMRPQGFEYELVLSLVTVTLLCAAVAACTKDLGRYFLIGLASFLIFSQFARNLDSLGFSRLRITEMQASVIVATWAVASILILLNQYRRRRIVRSVGVLIAEIGLSLALVAYWPAAL